MAHERVDLKKNNNRVEKSDIDWVVEFLRINIQYFACPVMTSVFCNGMNGISLSNFQNAIVGKLLLTKDRENALICGDEQRIRKLLANLVRVNSRKNTQVPLNMLEWFKKLIGDPQIDAWYAAHVQQEACQIRNIEYAKFLAEFTNLPKQKKIKSKYEEIQAYVNACRNYQTDLKIAIQAEIDKIDDRKILHSLYKILYPDAKKIEDIDIHLLAKKIYDALLKQPNNKIINVVLGNDYSILALTLEKYDIINKAREELERGKNTCHDKKDTEKVFLLDDTISKFNICLNDKMPILAKRRDKPFLTFLKALIVVGGTIFGFVGGYVAYHKFFGKEATRGKEFVDTTVNIGSSYRSTA